ncbi:MAG: protein jag [Oscillospiraceae bacterium]|jgi:spoIIIJ-associated protein|nr:protein jag [Oscillospiraceae bacterium]
MLKSIEVQGRTEDEAIENALEQLGMSRDDVSVEIIEQARTGFLGLKNTPAIVKVEYEAKEERTEQVEAYLTGLFERMDINVNLDITEKESAINVILTGKEPGALIGRRGETLDAIQQLTNYSINRSATGRVRINLDAENYRQRRNESLESLASRTASKVVKYRRDMTLDPMNAYERHIIHSTLQDNKQVSTFSVGNEPNRRVVVSFGAGGEKSERTSSPSYREWS